MPPRIPFTFQITPALVGSFCTVAVNCCVNPTLTVALLGDTLTDIGGGVMVTVADADLVGSATEVADTVTVGGFGTLAGAV